MADRDGLWELSREDARRERRGEEGDRLMDGAGPEGIGDGRRCGRAEGEESFLANEWRASSWDGEDRWMVPLSWEGGRESMTTGLRRDRRPESPCGIDGLQAPSKAVGAVGGSSEISYRGAGGSTQQCIAM